MTINLRPATLDDAAFLFRLRNDPETRANSLTEGTVEWDQHLKWLSKTLEHPEYTRLYIAESLLPTFPIGTGRLDLILNADCPAVAEVSLTVAPEVRDLGWGIDLLQQLIDTAKSLGYVRVTAKIKPVNIASVKLFTRLGFDGPPIHLEKRL